jgi:hypothetical protein
VCFGIFVERDLNQDSRGGAVGWTMSRRPGQKVKAASKRTEQQPLNPNPGHGGLMYVLTCSAAQQAAMKKSTTASSRVILSFCVFDMMIERRALKFSYIRTSLRERSSHEQNAPSLPVADVEMQ